MAVLRSTFIALSRNQSLRRFMERSWVGARLSSRFIAGMELDDALRVAEAVNQQGITVTLDSLGESVTSETEAHRAAEVYHQLLDAIAARKLNANISVKLTQMGWSCRPRWRKALPRAWRSMPQTTGNFVRIDMEDSSLTQVTMDIVRRLHARAELRGAIGVVIQAYLYRSQADIEQLMADGIRVRLCKGAYKEPAGGGVSAQGRRGQKLCQAEPECCSTAPIYHGLATHDESHDRRGQSVRRRARNRPRPLRVPDALWSAPRPAAQTGAGGIQRARVRSLRPEWYPYFMRRLAERPANVLFLARNFFR